MTKNLCIITARGGSKRIPRKNIKDFLGKPIIAYSIEAALQAEIFDEVMVSTDDLEIADVAKAYGAKVPFLRSPETSNDYASTRDVLLEVLKKYEEQGRSFEFFSCIYPTAPFITAEKLRTAFKQLKGSDADELTPVIPFSYPPQRAFVIEKGGLVYQFPEYQFSRSQDLQPIYHDCGQFYFYKTNIFRGISKGTGKRLPLILPEEETQDIDNYSDWDLAEIKYRKYILKEK